MQKPAKFFVVSNGDRTGTEVFPGAHSRFRCGISLPVSLAFKFAENSFGNDVT